MEEQFVDPMAGSDSSSVDAFQDSNNSNIRSNVDFWFDLLNANTNPNDAWLSSEWPSIRDDQWGHVFEHQPSPKKKRKKKNTERKLYLDKGSCSTVNSASDRSEALSGALSAISADLSLSSSASTSSHSSSQKSDPDRGVPMNETPWFQSDSLEERNGNVLASDSNGNEMSIESALDAREELKIINFSVPVVGMEFCSEEEAYNFYKIYAKGIGFRVRKGKVQRLSNGDIRKRYLFCSREGFRLKKQSNKKTKYKRKETRTGCNAKMECMVENGKWVISQFSEKHNHILGDHINLESQTGMSLVIRSNSGAEIEKDAEATKFVNSCSMDRITYVQGEKAGSLQPEDAQNLINYVRYLQAEDPSFFHTIQLDADCRVKNIFWRDGRAKIDYGYFGDVIILDTTFKLDKYGIICAPFLGINHHRQFVLFGCAFLLDESTDSFIWLLETFMEAMGRNQPKTIITDEGRAMGDAVKLKLPEAQHQIGLWYIQKNAAKHLSRYFALPGFKRLFDECISDCVTEEEFESRWSSLLEKFNLQGNEWLINMHASRNQWCHIFSKNTFTAGIQCNARIESIFQNLTGQVDAVSLSTLIEQYFRAAEQQRREELHEDLCCCETEPDMILAFCPAGVAEKQSANAYTRTMFKVFQKQLPTLFSVFMHKVTYHDKIATYKLSEIGKKKAFFVEFNCFDSTIACSCKKYESDGILCVHTLKILNERNIFEIPPQYILKRWTKSAKDGVAAVDHAGTADRPKKRLDVNQLSAGKAEEGAPFSSPNRKMLRKEHLACFETQDLAVRKQLHRSHLPPKPNGLMKLERVSAARSRYRKAMQLRHLKTCIETLREENNRLLKDLQETTESYESVEEQNSILRKELVEKEIELETVLDPFS